MTREETEVPRVDKELSVCKDELPWPRVELGRMTVVASTVVLDWPEVRLVTGELRMAVVPMVDDMG